MKINRVEVRSSGRDDSLYAYQLEGNTLVVDHNQEVHLVVNTGFNRTGFLHLRTGTITYAPLTCRPLTPGDQVTITVGTIPTKNG